MRQTQQAREQATGRFGFEGKWGRKCVCGHELGVHTAEAPHECMNNDRLHMMTVPAPDWFDCSVQPTACNCMRFRPRKKRDA